MEKFERDEGRDSVLSDELIKAAQLLREGCAGRICCDCPFGDSSGNLCMLTEEKPYCWNLPESGELES